MEPIHLKVSDVPAHLRPNYNGKHLKMQVGSVMVIPSDAGLSDGGSCERYTARRISDGREVDVPYQGTTLAAWQRISPFENKRGHITNDKLEIPPGIVVVCHSHFCGKDTGLTFHARQEDIAPMLPGKAPDLTPIEQTVLTITGRCKSAYRWQEASERGIAAVDYEAAKIRLTELDLLNAAGAITKAGRNVLADPAATSNTLKMRI